MSASIKVFKTVNFIGLYLGKAIWAVWLVFAFVVKRLWIALYFIPGHAFNMTLSHSPKGWKEWLNPFAYGVMEVQSDSWFAGFDNPKDKGDAAFFALIGIVGSFFVGLFLFLTYPVCGLFIRLYIKGAEEERKWKAYVNDAIETDSPEVFRE